MTDLSVHIQLKLEHILRCSIKSSQYRQSVPGEKCGTVTTVRQGLRTIAKPTPARHTHRRELAPEQTYVKSRVHHVRPGIISQCHRVNVLTLVARYTLQSNTEGGMPDE